MRSIVTTMTQRGQVTVPAEVRRLLGLKPRDKVAFEIADDKVRIVPAPSTLASTFGAVKPVTRTEDFKAISRAAREEKAAAEVQKLQQS